METKKENSENIIRYMEQKHLDAALRRPDVTYDELAEKDETLAAVFRALADDETRRADRLLQLLEQSLA